MKTYTKLTLPKDSAWNRKTYNPIVMFRQVIYNKWPHSFLDRNMDKYIFDPYEKIKNGLVNFWTWKSVIWKDRHWDDHFIFEVLKQKLISQREYLIFEYRHENVPTINRDITLCLNLIERVQEEYYEMEVHNFHNSEWNFTPVKNRPECSKLNIDTVSENLDTYFTLHKAAVKKCLKKDRTLSSSKEKLARAVAAYKQNQCSRLLFRVLSERIFWWWD